MYWFQFARFQVQALKYMGHLGEIQFSFPFPSLILDHFDVQDLKILLGIISFEVIVASSQHYGLKCIFCLILDLHKKLLKLDRDKTEVFSTIIYNCYMTEGRGAMSHQNFIDLIQIISVFCNIDLLASPQS